MSAWDMLFQASILHMVVPSEKLTFEQRPVRWRSKSKGCLGKAALSRGYMGSSEAGAGLA